LRGQDLGAAGQTGQWAAQQATLQGQQNALNAQTGLGFERLGFDVNNAQLNAQVQSQIAHNQNALQQWEAQMGADEHATDRDQNMFSGGLGAIGGLAGLAFI